MRKGTHHTEETKTKIATTKVGKTFTPEHSAAIGNALRGQKKSAAHRHAIGEGIKAAHARKVNTQQVDSVLSTDKTVA